MPDLITPELIHRVLVATSHSRPRTDEDPKKYLARQTHLHLQGRRLKSSTLPPGAMPLLKALYLFDNEIEKLDVGAQASLTHLYCQNNLISSFGADLASLTRLQKLYLNNNCLQSLAQLAPLQGLVELDASSQKLPPGEVFDVAPEVLSSMRQLRVLKLANNGLTSTAELAGCRSLETVDLSKNQLGNLASVAPLLGVAPLRELDLRGNTVSDVRQQLDAIIVSCPTIERLNGRELTQSERPYLQQLHRLGRRSIPLGDEQQQQPRQM